MKGLEDGTTDAMLFFKTVRKKSPKVFYGQDMALNDIFDCGDVIEH